nr:alpha/beta fold hydrolase [Motiliproteus sediminis]
MTLHYKELGQGDPLLILHGLFGTLENWGGQIKALSGQFRVFAIDLRNHGRSPWSEQMDYPSLSADLIAFMDQHGIERAAVLGHSMGGKAAMQLALDHPERVSRLLVVDIAPVRYPPGHNEVFDGLFGVDLAHLASRGDADQQLAAHIDDAGVRQFLLKNLYRDGDHFAWRMNLKALHREYEQIAAAPESKGHYPGPTQFIKGGRSSYIQEAHRGAIGKLFPNASARVMEGVGHWPHAEKPELFTRLALRFLQAP